MRIDFGKIFQETSKDKTMSGLVVVPFDRSLWPPAWEEVLYKTYERFKSIPMPMPMPKIFGHEELAKRRTVRNFGTPGEASGQKIYRKITLQELSTILYFSCGEVRKDRDGKRRRIQASGGGRYPIEAYVLNFEKGELDKKCYHYNVQNHTLEELWDVDIADRKDLRKYFGYEWSVDASMAIVLTAVPSRSVMKYGERGYKYVYLEAGAILQNIQNNAMVEGIGSVILGSVNENRIEKMLDLDGETETVMLSVLLG